MGKKVLMTSLIVASLGISMLGQNYKFWDKNLLNQKQLEGSAIYIPKRHKFKRRTNKWNLY